MIPEHWELPEKIRFRLGKRIGRQRAIFEEDHCVLVLHHVPEKGERFERERILFWRQPIGEWTCNENKAGRKSLTRLLDSYETVIEQLETDYESSDEIDSLFDTLEASVPIQRAVQHMETAISDARNFIPTDKYLIEFKHECHELKRAIDLLVIDVQHRIEYLTAKRSERQLEQSEETNKIGYQLNLLAMTLMPLTAIASVFGMNVLNGFESYPTWLFWIIFGGGIIIGFILKQFLIGKLKTRLFFLKKRNP